MEGISDPYGRVYVLYLRSQDSFFHGTIFRYQLSIFIYLLHTEILKIRHYDKIRLVSRRYRSPVLYPEILSRVVGTHNHGVNRVGAKAYGSPYDIINVAETK